MFTLMEATNPSVIFQRDLFSARSLIPIAWRSMGAGAQRTNSHKPTDDAYERQAKRKIWLFHKLEARSSKAFLNRLLTLKLQLLCFLFVFGATAPPVGQGLLIHEVSRSDATTHHSR